MADAPRHAGGAHHDPDQQVARVFRHHLLADAAHQLSLAGAARPLGPSVANDSPPDRRGVRHLVAAVHAEGLGYRIEFVFLRLTSPQLALRRIAARVRQGGHDVPRADVLRRFDRGWVNFETLYRPLADAWAVYDNSGLRPTLLENEP